MVRKTDDMDNESRHIFYTTHCHDLFYKTVQFHENNPEGIQNREHCSLNNPGEITMKIYKQQL